MILCNEWHKKIVKCIDNEADDNEQTQVAGHIQACSACQAFHESYSKIRQTYKAMAVPVLPHGIRRELLSKVQADITNSATRPLSSETEVVVKSRHLKWRWTLIAAAALFMIASLGVVCALLVRSNLALKKDLHHARQEVESLQHQKQIMLAQNRQQEAISELRGRVKDLEGRIRLGISPRTVWQPESPYYQPELPGKL